MIFDVDLAVKAQEEYCEKTGAPNFAGMGFCFHCGRNVYGEGGISVEDAGKKLVTSCPYCRTSFCE